MGKKSRRRSLRFEKDQSGCMWGLISILHLRHGRISRKMLSDKRHESNHAAGVGYLWNKLEILTDCDGDCQANLDNRKCMTGTGDAGKPLVKKLIEDEMMNELGSKKKINSTEVKEKQSENRLIEEDRKGTNKIVRKSSDVNINDLNAEKGYTNNLDIDAIMDEFCHHIRQKSISCENHGLNSELYVQSTDKNSGFEEKLCEAIKMFVSQKICNAENLAEDEKFYSEQLVDALEILCSDKEFFLKLQKDPNSLFLKHFQISEDGGIEREEKTMSVAGSRSEKNDIAYKQTDELVNRKQHNFFWRKVKSREEMSFEGNKNPQALNRIVILKPNPTGPQSFGLSQKSHFKARNKESSEKVFHNFSFTKIKKKLKHAMGKERRGNLAEVIPEKVPNGRTYRGVNGENFGRKSPGKDHLFVERHVKPSIGITRGDKTSKQIDSEISREHETAGHSKQSESNIYIEAKKHLSEILNSDEDDGISSKTVPKSLGQILSLPEYIYSPIRSPQKNWEHSFVTAQMRLSAFDKSSSGYENTWRFNNAFDHDPNDKVEALNSEPSISLDLLHDNTKEASFYLVGDKMSSEGDVEIEKVAHTAFKEESQVLETPPEISSSSISRHDQDGHTPELSYKKEHCEYLKQNSHEENQQFSPLSSPSSSSISHKVEDLEKPIDIPERPSPVSVLEPMLTEDDISPTRTTCQPVELQMQPLQIHFEDWNFSSIDYDFRLKTCIMDKEVIFGYVKAVLQASGLSWDELYIKSLSTDQLLDPSLFDEVQFFPNQHRHEHQLLFDCINEVIIEIYGYYFGSSPWMSFVKPSIYTISNTKNAIHEVWDRVYWHIQPQPLPHSLDQIIGKDMEQNTAWMDLRHDTECLGADKGDTILEELIEDTILSFVTEITESD